MNGIADDGRFNPAVNDACLFEIEKLENLRHLELFETSVTDVGVQALRTAVNLEVLRVDKTSVSDVGVQRLRESLPKLQIIR